MTTPIVSFVMPAYNVAQYLPTAVEAIKAQTMTDWELIIVDDCSSDNTLEIAQSYAGEDSRIRLLQTERQSGGAYIPRKIAIENAESEIIAPLDADDNIEPDYLRRLLAKMGKEEEIDIVYPIMYHWNGKSLGDPYPHDKSLYGIPVPGRDMVKYTLDGWRIHCNGGLIKRATYLDTLRMIDIDKVEVKSFIDECLTRLLLFNARKVVMCDVRYYYLENENSITHTTDIRAFGQLWNNAILLPFIRNHYSPDSEERALMERQNFHSFFDALKLMKKATLKKEDQERVIRMIKSSRRNADRHILRKKASRKYYAIYQFPIRVISFLLP